MDRSIIVIAYSYHCTLYVIIIITSILYQHPLQNSKNNHNSIFSFWSYLNAQYTEKSVALHPQNQQEKYRRPNAPHSEIKEYLTRKVATLISFPSFFFSNLAKEKKDQDTREKNF